MHIKTILNKCHKFKRFVYERAFFVEDEGTQAIYVEILPRKNSAGICSGCQRQAPGYDRLEEWKFEFIPLWGFLVFFIYRMRRVACPGCGIKVEAVPWVDGKHQQTKTYMQFLAHWAKKLSWKEVAESFRPVGRRCFMRCSMLLLGGLERRDVSGITATGVDEIQWHRGPSI